jgi:hypothetical protein
VASRADKSSGSSSGWFVTNGTKSLGSLQPMLPGAPYFVRSVWSVANREMPLWAATDAEEKSRLLLWPCAAADFNGVKEAADGLSIHEATRSKGPAIIFDLLWARMDGLMDGSLLLMMVLSDVVTVTSNKDFLLVVYQVPSVDTTMSAVCVRASLRFSREGQRLALPRIIMALALVGR